MSSKRKALTRTVFVLVITEFLDNYNMRGNLPSYVLQCNVFSTEELAKDAVYSFKKNFVSSCLDEKNVNGENTYDFEEKGIGELFEEFNQGEFVQCLYDISITEKEVISE